MRKILIEMTVIFMIFFAGATGILMIDNICFQYTGVGGKLVLDIDK